MKQEQVQQYTETVGYKLAGKADSLVTYCAGGGLAGFSCLAEQMQPILAVIGGIVGIGVCLSKGYYDWKKHQRSSVGGRPRNDN